MAKTTYVQIGENLDYKNETETAIAAGDLVKLETRVGVAATEILAGETGAVCVRGVFKMPKSGTAAVKMGALVYFDGTGITNTAGTNTPAGYAAASAAAADTEILVNLLG